ncbi:hypothetical protein [Kitasatospora sp. NPDC088134]|uniref:hypothetical protein n=1 Tax=Kitasatospora sp. NPDC088134 TaxID=3364071 RepID=UPI0038153F87
MHYGERIGAGAGPPDEDVLVPPESWRPLALPRRQPDAGGPADGGVERWFHKPLPGGRHLVVRLRPGIYVGLVNESPEQTFETVWLDTRPGDHWPAPGRRPERLGTLDPVTSSELLVELAELTAP